LESAKATMEVPAPFAGTVREVKVKENDTVSQGSVIALIEAGDEKGASKPAAPAEKPAAPAASESTPKKSPSAGVIQPKAPAAQPEAAHAPKNAQAEQRDESGPRSPPVPFDADTVAPGKVPYASPAVRAFARELGVDLARVRGSERGGRITKEDVQAFVKSALAGGGTSQAVAAAGTGLNLLPWPQVDFSKYGEVEEKPLSRIKKLSGANLARNWAMIPHVTQHELADITDMEAFRKQLGAENMEVKVTPLVFMVKAVVAALKQYPQFNASLDASGEKLILKKYFHVGIAVDTPDGLVVPVIRDCDRKGILELAIELGGISKKARDKKLSPADMSGGCFSISSLGGIGGTSFTPIINAPEVAILGVSRSSMRPVWSGGEFKPRLMLPLSLSYDHRVIDGAMAARFTAYLS
ncbi:MAG: dihydrolipoyllysine-residue acetyltransferase, partial [Rhodanobacteraceae bacterium]